MPLTYAIWAATLACFGDGLVEWVCKAASLAA